MNIHPKRTGGYSLRGSAMVVTPASEAGDPGSSPGPAALLIKDEYIAIKQVLNF